MLLGSALKILVPRPPIGSRLLNVCLPPRIRARAETGPMAPGHRPSFFKWHVIPHRECIKLTKSRMKNLHRSHCMPIGGKILRSSARLSHLATAANESTGAANAATTPSSAHRRRIMVRNVHAESLAPRRERALDRVLTYAKSWSMSGSPRRMRSLD